MEVHLSKPARMRPRRLLGTLPRGYRCFVCSSQLLSVKINWLPILGSPGPHAWNDAGRKRAIVSSVKGIIECWISLQVQLMSEQASLEVRAHAAMLLQKLGFSVCSSSQSYK